MRRRMMLEQKVNLTGLALAQKIAQIGSTKTIDTANHTAQFTYSAKSATEGWHRTIIECKQGARYEITFYVVSAVAKNTSIAFRPLVGSAATLNIPQGYTGAISLLTPASNEGDRICLDYYTIGLITYNYDNSYIREL